jgi:hypothetical protein
MSSPQRPPPSSQQHLSLRLAYTCTCTGRTPASKLLHPVQCPRHPPRPAPSVPCPDSEANIGSTWGSAWLSLSQYFTYFSKPSWGDLPPPFPFFLARCHHGGQLLQRRGPGGLRVLRPRLRHRLLHDGGKFLGPSPFISHHCPIPQDSSPTTRAHGHPGWCRFYSLPSPSQRLLRIAKIVLGRLLLSPRSAAAATSITRLLCSPSATLLWSTGHCFRSPPPPTHPPKP